MKLLKQINKEDIKIYDLSSNFGDTGYNIGDLLNMPYIFESWGQNYYHADKNIYENAIKTAKNNPETILNTYYTSRPETENIPNIDRILDSTNIFLQNSELLNNAIVNEYILNDNSIICLLRVGSDNDFGDMDSTYYDTILFLSRKYKNVIILSGIGRHIYTDENANYIVTNKNNLIRSINKLCSLSDNIYYINDITPDEQLCIMKLAKNLLVHRGGFNLLGVLLCCGNIYATEKFLPYYTNRLKNILNKQKKNIRFINNNYIKNK